VPEQADLARAVTGDLAEPSAAGEEAVARLDHAELVAVRVGQHHVALVRELAHVQVPPAEGKRRRDRPLLVLERGAGDVEVQAVGACLLRRGRHEEQSHLRVVPGQQRTARLRDDLPVEHPGPEQRHAGRIVSVEGHGHESRGHLRTLGPGAESDNRLSGPPGIPLSQELLAQDVSMSTVLGQLAQDVQEDPSQR
jgi:hypothetical protein